MRLRTKLVLSGLFSCAFISYLPVNKPTARTLVQEKYPVQEDHIQKSAAGADFIYQSRITQTSDKKYKLESSVRNSGNGPLSVKWKDAGITCTGFLQLQPGQTDYGTSKGIADVPALINSTISYGNGLQYSTPARMYVDPQPKGEKSTSRTAEYKRLDTNGSLVFSIAVTSTLDQAKNVSNLSFAVTGDLSLAISGGALTSAESQYSNRSGWLITGTSSLDSLVWGNAFSASRWLEDTAPFAVPKGEGRFVIFDKREGLNKQLALALFGERWSSEQVRLIAFVPGKAGFVGLSANIFLPGADR